MNITAQIRQDADAQERKRQLAQLLAARGARQISEHPVSRGQQALWFLHEAAPESPAYTVVCALRLRGALDTGALQRALQRIVDRHQQLRAGFHMQADGQLIQRIHGWREVALPRTQLPPMPAPPLGRALMRAVRRHYDAVSRELALEEGGRSERALPSRVHALVPQEALPLAAVHVMTTLTGSALLALAVAGGVIEADAAWQAAHVDEDWNRELWGEDEAATARRAARRLEMDAAVALLRLGARAG